MPTPRFPPYNQKTMFPSPQFTENFMVLAEQWVTKSRIMSQHRRYRGVPILTQDTVQMESVWVECKWVGDKLMGVALPERRIEMKHIKAWMRLPDKSTGED